MRKYHLIAVITGVALIAMGFNLGTNKANANKSRPSGTLTRVSLPLPTDRLARADHSKAALQPVVPVRQHHEKIRKGDNMAIIFKRAGLSARQLHHVMNSGDAAQAYRSLYAGQSVAFTLQDTKLVALRLTQSRTRSIESRFEGDRWHTRQIEEQVGTRLQHANGVIEDSLFISGSKAGLSDNTIMQLAGIFGWDIDFALDIRKGDRFSVIYEGKYLDGEKIGDGNIIAAEFINQGNRYQAVRYTAADNTTDYYAPDGRSMRKAFLRTPVKFSRISSRFTRKRWHPVLNKWRSHKGVDYAAPRGTPVKATSDGTVAYKGRKGGYGKAIFINNGKTYTTVYGHLNSYAKNIRKRSRVKQGQIIGYVGSTGLATGPHLHYELRINGVHRNPLTAKLPKARPIAKQYRQDFRQSTKPLLARLALINNAHLAAVSPDSSSGNKTINN